MPTRTVQVPATPGRPATRRPGTARGIAVLGELVEGIPRRVLLPSGAIAVLVVAALVFLVVLRPSTPTAVRQTASPTAPPPSHNTVINSFFRVVRDPKATFAVVVKGEIAVTAAATTKDETVNADFRIVGDDWSGSLVVAGKALPELNASLARIGTESWVRKAGATAWTRAAQPAQTASINPFPWIATVDELTYVEMRALSGGGRQHLLQTTKWLSGSEYDALSLDLVDIVRESTFVVAVDDHGTPLTATYDLSIRGRQISGAGALVLTSHADYTFTRWGAPIAIERPG